METFQILFRSSRRVDPGKAEDALAGFLAALSKNGQILGETPTARMRNGYVVFANVPRRDSLDQRHGNRWVRRAAKDLLVAGVSPPRVRWLGSEPGSLSPCEHYAHRQLSDWRSPLSREGLDLAALLRRKTGKPVYYYLMKHLGASDARERRRVCPSCKRKWLLARPMHRIFDFQCQRCRLLSNVAFDVRNTAV